MENECEALPGVAYPGVRDNRSTINTKTGYDEYDDYHYTSENKKIFNKTVILLSTPVNSSTVIHITVILTPSEVAIKI